MLDLAILTCRAVHYIREESYRYPALFDPDHPQIDRVGLQGDAMTVAVCTENECIGQDIALFRDALARDGDLLGERMQTLARLLAELGYHG